MTAKEKLLEKRNEEMDYKNRLVKLEEESTDVLDEYYKEYCGNDYKDIKQTLTDLRNAYFLEDDSYKMLNEHLNTILDKGLKGIISKKTFTGSTMKPNHSYGYYYRNDQRNIVLSKYGLGLDFRGRAKVIESLDDRLKAINTLPTNITDKIWYNNKKVIFETFQTHLTDWRLIENIDKDIPIDREIEFRADDTIFGFKLDNKEMHYRLHERYSSSLRFGNYYSSNIVLNLNDRINDVSDYQCFLAKQVWDIIKPILKSELLRIENARSHNLKIFEALLKDVRKYLVLTDL